LEEKELFICGLGQWNKSAASNERGELLKKYTVEQREWAKGESGWVEGLKPLTYDALGKCVCFPETD
jgi:hypothetical protein